MILPKRKPLVLLILDGWGISVDGVFNAVSIAHTPNFDSLVTNFPSTVLSAAEDHVGLLPGTMGNSEVGHLSIGSGRIIYHDLPKINRSIEKKDFYKNKVLLKAIRSAKKNKKKLHFLGLVSDGHVHSSLNHLKALLLLAKKEKMKETFIHVILDGRDTYYKGGLEFVNQLKKFIEKEKIGNIATISGRFWTMDRNNNWDRIEKSYNAMVNAKGVRAKNYTEEIEKNYKNGIYDENIEPIVVMKGRTPVAKIQDGDSLIFFNYRADRARQISKAFLLPEFNKFKRKFLKNLYFVSFTEYEKELTKEIVFTPEIINNNLGDILAANNLSQLRIAETEKYAHVTYFFNGGREEKNKGEEHILIPSPIITSYDQKPEMSAFLITDKFIKEINKGIYNFSLINLANPDMVGHTGNLEATIKAIEITDYCLGKIMRAVFDQDGSLIVTADHGNAEIMFNAQIDSIHKGHTVNPVPFIIASKNFEGRDIGKQKVLGQNLHSISPQGIISDISPTILKLMGLDKPKEMKGESLI